MPNNTRKTVIAGNWKMNKTPAEAVALIKEIRAEIDGKNTAGCDVVACVPYVDLAVVLEACKGSVIKVGAENVHWEKSGAYTGEISADMLKEIGVEYVIVGHSERRQYFGETDETVNLRVKAALAAGLKVILCVGELLAQREQGITDEVVSLQTKVALQGVGAEALKNVIIAYEPVWAIGTGRTATSEQADEVCGVIRGVVAGLYSDAAADALTVQYGGSMNAKNARELLAQEQPDFKQNKKQILDKGNFFPSPFAAMNTQLLFHGSEHLEMLVQQLLVCGQLGIGPFKVAHHVPACLFFTFRSSHILDLGQFF